MSVTGYPKTRGKRARAELISKCLDELYPSVEVPLYHRDAFTLLIAVLLSAQCTDKRVNQVTQHLFSVADNPSDMAEMDEEDIRDIIASCGLANTKARNIKSLSQKLIEDHEGRVPQSFAGLESLPGVGHKTASVVMSQAFGIPAFPVDTHIHRLAQRWRLTNGKSVAQTEADLKKLFPEEYWNKIHIQMILYGREHCTARGCDGTVCAICRECFPTRKPVKTRKA